MKKYLFLPILFIFINCTALNNLKTVSGTEMEKITFEVTETASSLKEAAKLNKYEKLKEFFLPTFKNNYIVKEMEQYDLSKLTFLFSEVKVISKVKATSIMVINYGNESNYYIVTWKKIDENGQWKVSNVAEKK